MLISDIVYRISSIALRFFDPSLIERYNLSDVPAHVD